MIRQFLSDFIAFFLIVSMLACGGNSTEKQSTTAAAPYTRLAGKTMGTTYHITYKGTPVATFQSSVDSLLLKINAEVSTYEKEAIISQFNRSPKGVQLEAKAHDHFLNNYKAIAKIYTATEGYFDPTVMPVVNYWGFGYTGKQKIKRVDSLKIKELLPLIGFDRVVQLDETQFLSKSAPGVQLDFSALAKGYAVDEICNWFSQKEIHDFYVEIGGELRVKGKNPQGEDWTIGINKPQEKAAVTDFMFRVPLKNVAIATSGNYRNVYEVDGIKYFHTISPFSGFPQRNRLLSASVIAPDCLTADAYATAFMAMGLEKSYKLASEMPSIEAALIYSDDRGQMEVRYTAGFHILE